MKYKKLLKKINSSEFWSKLAKNVFIVLTGNIGASIINFLVTIIIVRCIGNFQYGLLVVAQQYMNLLDGIINFQSWSGVIKYGTEAIVEKNDKRLAVIFKTGYCIDIFTAILGSIIAVVALPFASTIMSWDTEMQMLALVFSLEIVFHIEGTSTGILRLYNKFNLTSIQLISSALLKFLIIGIYFLSGGRNLLAVTILYVITDVIKHLILFFMGIHVLRKRMGIHTMLKAKLRDADKEFVKYTIWANVGSSADIPVKYFDVFIVSLISTDIVAIYKVFKQIIQILSMLTNPVSMAVLPQFSELVAYGHQGEAFNKVKKLRNGILFMGIVPILFSMTCGGVIFDFFLGAEYAENLKLFIVLLFVNILLIANVGIHPLFSAMGFAREDFIYALATNLMYILIAYLTVPHIGIYGIILATGAQGLSYIAIKYRIINKSICCSES